MNKLKSLGRGFGACPSLEVLDITSNKMSEEGLPGNFWMMGKVVKLQLHPRHNSVNFIQTCMISVTETLRALYMGDNYFETLSPEVGRLRSLQIVNNNHQG